MWKFFLYFNEVLNAETHIIHQPDYIAITNWEKDISCSLFNTGMSKKTNKSVFTQVNGEIKCSKICFSAGKHIFLKDF